MNFIKTELLQIASDVNRILMSYVAIHDAMFKFNWRHIIPLPFIFKAIDYPVLQSQAVAVLTQLRNCESNLKDLGHRADTLNMSEQETHFLHFLSEYVLALIET